MLKISCEPTYTYIKPFYFMGKPINNSVELATEFAAHWDIALSVFKRGDMASFWEEQVGMSKETGQWHREEEFQQLYDRMWQISDNVNEDVVFQKVFYLIEPASDLIPVPRPGDSTMRFMKKGDFLGYVQDVLLWADTDLFIEMYEKGIDYHAKWDKEFDEKFENLYLLYQMWRESSFYCWHMGSLQSLYDRPRCPDNGRPLKFEDFGSKRLYYMKVISILREMAERKQIMC